MPGLVRGSKEWVEAMNSHYYQDPDVMYLLGLYEAQRDQLEEGAQYGRHQESSRAERSGIDDEFSTGG